MAITNLEQYKMTPDELKGGAGGQTAYSARIAGLRGEPTPSTTPDTPTSFTQEAPLGNLSNLRSALKTALQEAAERKSESRIRAVSPLMEGGAAPSVLTAAIGLAKQGLAESRDRLFSDIMEGVSEEQKIADTKRKSAMDSINQMMDDGVFGDTPDGSLLATESQAGLSEGTILAWKARYNIAKKQGDDKEALELQNLKNKIYNTDKDGGTDAGNAGVDIT